MRRRAFAPALLLVALGGCSQYANVTGVTPENPLTADLVNYRNGLQLLREGRVDEAIQLLRRSQESYPYDPNVRNALGLALLYKKEYPLALKSFDEALRLDPTLAEVMTNRGVTLLEMGRLDEADTQFQKILDGPPSKEKLNAHFNLGMVRIKQERPAEAEAQFSLVIAEDPKYSRAYRERGLVRAGREDFRGGLEDLLRFLQDEPKEPKANYQAALCLLTTGRRDLAARYMERVIAAAPDSEEAGKARRFLAGESTGDPRRTP